MLRHRDDPDYVLRELGNAPTRTRSDLVTPRSASLRVPEPEADSATVTSSRTTRRPARSADDLISQIDLVSRSIAGCIRLGEDALHHHDDPDRIPFGLRNAAATYSDHIRVRRPNPATVTPDLQKDINRAIIYVPGSSHTYIQQNEQYITAHIT